MMITKTSILTRETRTKEINVTKAQYDAWLAGMLIQDAMPHLSADDREFILTGVTETEWNNFYNDEADYD